MKNNVIILKNKKVSISILPDIGGRIIELKRQGFKNILFEKPEFWNDKIIEGEKPFSKNPIWKPYGGQIVWVGAQDEWWEYQDYSRIKKKIKSTWPPDPFLIYSKYNIIERSDNFLHLISPKSKISNVQIEKTIILKSSGKIIFKVKLINIFNEKRKLDIWFNLRMNFFDKAYVPINDNSDVKVNSGKISRRTDNVKYAISNNYFHFIKDKINNLKIGAGSKAFIYPATGNIYGFNNDTVLNISFDLINKDKIHEKQALVEIYNGYSKKYNYTVLELEQHSEAKYLKPGEAITSEQTWELKEYIGSNSTEGHLKYLSNNH